MVERPPQLVNPRLQNLITSNYIFMITPQLEEDAMNIDF